MSSLAQALALLSSAFLIAYGLVISDWTRGVERLYRRRRALKEEGERAEGGLRISIVIPVRDERGYWDRLFEDLQNQKGLGEEWELIFVDDHSTDGSSEAIVEKCDGAENFHCYQLPEGQSGKKSALTLGIRNASGPWVLTLDADCRIGPHFMKKLSERSQKEEADLFLLPVLPHTPKGFLQHLVHYEALALLGALMGSAGNSRPVLANGAGMLFYRKTFFETGGYDSHLSIDSGDDLFLLQEWKEKGKRIRALADKDLLICTRHPKDFREFIRQRLRWASKAKAFRSKATILAFGIVGGMNIFLMLSFLLSILHPPHSVFTLLSWAFKGGFDRSFLFSSGRGFEKNAPWGFFLLALFVYPFLVSLLPLMRLFSRPVWKGRLLEDR